MIKELISSGKVVIFSKTTCPYCIKVKNFFKNEAKCDYVSYELNEIDNGAEIKEELVKLTNQTTVPSIFINSIIIFIIIFILR